MGFKQILSVLMVTICLCTSLCLTAYAEETDMYISDEIVPTYEIARSLNSALSISGTKAMCESRAEGDDCVSITVTHTLQKYSGWFWIWDNVENATSEKTVNTNTVRLSTTQNGLESGTYRLKSTFSLTSSFGSIETITIYSGEETI